ncbi:MAG: SGNH hydrolase domain-containing protein, partial [Bacteroidota bacterium]
LNAETSQENILKFQQSNTNVAFYSIFTRFWQLGAGVLLFLLMHGLGKEIRAPFFVSFFISSIGFVAILCGFFMVPPQGFPWPYALLPTLGTMMLIAGNGLSEQNHIRRFLSSGYLVDIGKRSYSIYLWHWPVIVLMGWTVGIGDADSVLIAIAITLTLSEISYRLIETPLRRSDKLQSFKKRTQIFSMISAAVVSLGISFILVANTDSLSLSEANRNAQVWYPDRGMPTPHPGVINCRLEQLPDTSATPVAVFAPTDCNGAELANVEGLSGRLFVVGDSHAGMLVPALTFFAQETGVEVRVLYGAGCPYIDLAKPSDHITTPRQCTIAKSRIDEYLLQNLRAGDVLLLPSLRLPRFRDQSSHELAQGLEEVMFSADASALRALAMSEARQTLAQFEQTGASVLITAPTPVFRAPAFRCVDWFNKNSELCKNNLSIAKDEISRAHARVVADLASLREQSGNLHIFDMLDHFCDSNACFAVSNEYPLFFDGDHLSAFGNKVIYPPLKLAIIEALGLTGAAYDRVLNDTTQRSAKMRTLLGMQVNEDFLHPDLADWILESSMDLSDGDFLSLSYQRVLGRAPDPEGKSYWIGRLESG